jgi:Rod binding domain-containing protein
MRIDSPSSATGTASGAGSAAQQKLHKSAGEFEAMLLTNLWKNEQDSEDEEGGQDMLGGMKGPLQDVAFQAIAMKAVGSKGFGIARMIEHAMEPKLASGHDPSEPGKTLPAADIGVMHAYDTGSASLAARD